MQKDGRSLPHEVLEAYRRSAVILHRQKVPVKVIAQSCGVNVDAVYKWLHRAKKFGLSSLKSTLAAGPEPRLTSEQFDDLLRALRQPATKLGYSTDLWSGPRIRHYLKKKFRIEYHPKHMPRLLRRLGLVLKFPERRSLEQDPKKVREWKKKRLPEILQYARKRGGLVFYADECLITLIPYIGKTWTFPKAHPVVRVSGKRGQNVGVTAAVNQQGRLCFEVTKEKERFTAKVFLRFVRKLRKEHPSRPIVLIVDGARVHTAKLVKAFEKENSSWLRLEILPAYSPEFNPTEKCWGFVKTKKLNGSTAQDKVELRHAATKVMRDVKRDPKRVATFFL